MGISSTLIMYYDNDNQNKLTQLLQFGAFQMSPAYSGHMPAEAKNSNGISAISPYHKWPTLKLVLLCNSVVCNNHPKRRDAYAIFFSITLACPTMKIPMISEQKCQNPHLTNRNARRFMRLLAS